MTVGELITILQRYDAEMVVLIDGGAETLWSPLFACEEKVERSVKGIYRLDMEDGINTPDGWCTALVLD